MQRVWIALEEKGIPYLYKEVDPYKKEPHFLKVNPKGLVPALGESLSSRVSATCQYAAGAQRYLSSGGNGATLTTSRDRAPAEHDNKALYESLVLLEYLDDAFPDSAIRPRDPHELGLVRLACQQISNVVVPAFYRYMQAQEADKQKEGHEAFVKALRDVHGQWFVKGAEWARGDKFGWVDCVLGPWVARFALLEKHRAFKAEDVGPEFKAWCDRLLARPSVKATTSLPENYESVYRPFFPTLSPTPGGAC